MKQKQVKRRRRLNRWIKEAEAGHWTFAEWCILRKARLYRKNFGSILDGIHAASTKTTKGL